VLGRGTGGGAGGCHAFPPPLRLCRVCRSRPYSHQHVLPASDTRVGDRHAAVTRTAVTVAVTDHVRDAVDA